jgi:hypothetical protein
MSHTLNIHPPGVTLSATIEDDIIFIIRLAADDPGEGWGGNAIEEIQQLGKTIKLFSVADYPCLQSNLDRFYFSHGFKVEGNCMVWRPEKKI